MKIDDARRDYAIDAAVQSCNDFQLTVHILDSCKRDQLQKMFPILIERQLWKATLYVIGRGCASDELKVSVLPQACKTADEETLCSLLDHCSSSVCGCESLLSTMISRGFWSGVAKMLETVTEQERRQATEEACKGDVTEHFMKHILSYCCSDQLDNILHTFVERADWKAVGTMLTKEGVTESKKKWAVSEALKTANTSDVAEHFLNHLDDAQLERTLQSFVDKDLWELVHNALQSSLKDDVRSWLIKVSSENASAVNYS
jgi:predicted RNA-binding protein YlxR (DUF448 family)